MLHLLDHYLVDDGQRASSGGPIMVCYRYIHHPHLGIFCPSAAPSLRSTQLSKNIEQPLVSRCVSWREISPCQSLCSQSPNVAIGWSSSGLLGVSSRPLPGFIVCGTKLIQASIPREVL